MRRLLGNLLAFVVAVVVALGLGELAARLFVPGWVPDQAYRIFWRYDPLLGWSLRPGAKGVHRHTDFAANVEISSQGLRDRVYPVERTPGMRRLLLLGDSYTWGFGVEREAIWHELIEARRPGWEIINTGVAGYGTGQQLLYFEQQGRAFQPDVVLLLVHQTDFKDNNESVVYGYYKPTFVPRDDGGLELTQVPVPQLDRDLRFDGWLRKHTWFLYRLYHFREFAEAAWEARLEERAEAAQAAAAEAAKASVPPAAAPRRAKLPHDHPERVARRAAREAERARAAQARRKPSKFAVDQTVTERLLARLAAAVEESGARFLVASTPMPDPPHGPFVASVARLRLAHLDLTAALEGQADVQFRHDSHWTPKGNAIVADAVEAFLVEQGVFEPPPARSAQRPPLP
jgi:hypothetical protein